MNRDSGGAAASVAELTVRLAAAPTRRMQRRLYRCVPLLRFQRGKPASFLHTSGRPGRCNPPGVRCLYFAEEEAVAVAEYRRYWRGLLAEPQPRLTYVALVRFTRVLDLAAAAALAALALAESHLHEEWRGRPKTHLQTLGEAVAGQRAIAAIRYPSAAAAREGKPGWNLAIYPDALTAPDRVEILGDSPQPLEVLP